MEIIKTNQVNFYIKQLINNSSKFQTLPVFKVGTEHSTVEFQIGGTASAKNAH